MKRHSIYENLWAAVVICGLTAGCIIISLPTNGNDQGTIDPDNGQQGNTGNSNGPNANDLTVVLSVSNPNPQVGEEVTLSCNIISGTATDPVFDFQPSDRLVAIGTTNGSAFFIVDETDTNIEFTFTCIVTVSGVTSDPSPPQTIIPTAVAFP